MKMKGLSPVLRTLEVRCGYSEVHSKLTGTTDAAHPRAIKSLQSSSGRSSRAATVVPGSLKTVVQAKEDSQTKKNADEEEGDDHQKI